MNSLCAIRNLLAAEDRVARKESLPALALILKIIHEFEASFPEIDYGDVGRRTHL